MPLISHGATPRQLLASERPRAGVPFGHWNTTTFTAGLSRIGMVALCVLDGPMNADAFLTYATRLLVPELVEATWSSWTTC